MGPSPRYIILDNFFPHLPQMLDNLKSREHWASNEHPARPESGNWPGKRSLNYMEHDPILSSLFTVCAGEYMPQYNYGTLCTHWRFGENKDWAHVDNNLCTGLVYLSETNMSSGTQFFDKDPDDGGKVILDVPFVQNRCVLFYGDPYHRSKSNYGESKDDARFTMNFFAH